MFQSNSSVMYICSYYNLTAVCCKALDLKTLCKGIRMPLTSTLCTPNAGGNSHFQRFLCKKAKKMQKVTNLLVDCFIPNLNRFSLTFTGKNMILPRKTVFFRGKTKIDQGFDANFKNQFFAKFCSKVVTFLHFFSFFV